MPIVTKELVDAAGVSFTIQLFDDGTGNLVSVNRTNGTSATITSVTVGTTSADMLSTLLGANVKTDRTDVEFQIVSGGPVYVGPSGVTAGNGRKLSTTVGDGSWAIPLDASSEVYLIADASATVIVTQV